MFQFSTREILWISIKLPAVAKLGDVSEVFLQLRDM